ncbi:glutamine-hydrolyzing GMP synthase [Candidatus Gracilibacteria bacterium]|nr:glutamine-hydrolyzing GMP synthase [Candidatus Gracilibacteria bacterium]
MHEKIIILDFGGQYAHLIASRIRRENVLAEIFNPEDISVESLNNPLIKGIILSGGPQSVFEKDSPRCDPAIFELGKPVLGICYGHQFLSHSLGGKVQPGKIKEYGRASLKHDETCPLFTNIPKESVFWMSHGDEVVTLPKGFQTCGNSEYCENSAVWHPKKNLFGIQFHPEVTHSKFGSQLLQNFIEICEVAHDWTIEKFFKEHETTLREKIGNKNVFLFVSGGVDSTVAFSFLSKILGENRVRGLFVNTGLLRKNEAEFVENALRKMGADLTVLHEETRFLENLKNVFDPEKKREIIGNTFLQVQQDFFSKNDLHDDWILAQGTIYPDTIETGGTKNSAKIKTHHNRVPEIQKLIDQGLVIEPLAELYKDEVRNLGELLSLPHNLVWRHPFPGPGLGVRILCSKEDKTLQDKSFQKQVHSDFIQLPINSVGVQGDARTYRHPAILRKQSFHIENLEYFATNLINKNPEINRALFLLGTKSKEDFKSCKVKKCFVTKDRIKTLQQADDFVTQSLESMTLYGKVWQFPTVLIPISFNGIGEESIILRPINSIDAMSASVGNLPWEFFTKVTAQILTNPKISAVFLDITSKPPGTIEWE